MKNEDLDKFNVSELGDEEALNINGGGILSSLIKAGFTLLRDWMVDLFNGDQESQ